MRKTVKLIYQLKCTNLKSYLIRNVFPLISCCLLYLLVFHIALWSLVPHTFLYSSLYLMLLSVNCYYSLTQDHFKVSISLGAI